MYKYTPAWFTYYVGNPTYWTTELNPPGWSITGWN